LKRRELIKFIVGAAAARPFYGRAQSDRMRRIGVLLPVAEDDPEGRARVAALVQALDHLGWVENRNLRLDMRWAEGDASRISKYATELVSLAPDLLVGTGSPIVAALRQATPTIPIVFAMVSDPVGDGLVESLAKPGGNVTGYTHFEYTIGGKWIELLKGAVPRIGRVAVMQNPRNPSWAGYFQTISKAASSFDLQVTQAAIYNASEIEPVMEEFAREPDGAIVVLPDITTTGNRVLILSLAARYSLPTMCPFRYFAMSGSLLSYGPNTVDQYRLAASYIDRILKGAQASDLPVQAPTKYELLVNLRTAKALGLTISPTLLAQADEVIE
jgi:putative tryptophan/tyrosine transport system substrate-binding protein